MALELVVSGATGRMGRALGRLAGAAHDLRLIGGIARGGEERRDGGDGGDGGQASGEDADYPRIVPVEDAAGLLESADAIIDFSAPDQLRALLEQHADRLVGRALIVGTTALNEDIEDRLERAAAAAPVLVASNFSVGVNLLLHLVRQAAAALPADAFDAEIVETHHRRKEDAPSGTALSLGRALADGRGAALDALRRDGRSGRTGARPEGEIGMHALRGGGVVGEHRVHFLGERERIELAHAASERAVFAAGALTAARWLAGREPGRYTMDAVLGLSTQAGRET